LLQQREVVLKVPVLGDAAIHHVIQVERLEVDRLSLPLHGAELAGEMTGECSRTDTWSPFGTIWVASAFRSGTAVRKALEACSGPLTPCAPGGKVRSMKSGASACCASAGSPVFQKAA
jgi:hypothetical protein